MNETANNVIARIVFENTKPEQLKSVMRTTVLKVNEQTKVSVKHEQKAVQQPVDLEEDLL